MKKRSLERRPGISKTALHKAAGITISTNYEATANHHTLLQKLPSRVIRLLSFWLLTHGPRLQSPIAPVSCTATWSLAGLLGLGSKLSHQLRTSSCLTLTESLFPRAAKNSWQMINEAHNEWVFNRDSLQPKPEKGWSPLRNLLLAAQWRRKLLPRKVGDCVSLGTCQHFLEAANVMNLCLSTANSGHLLFRPQSQGEPGDACLCPSLTCKESVTYLTSVCEDKMR